MTQPNPGLDQLERGVSDPSVALSSLLLQCLVLARNADSQTLQSWASNELNGYPGALPGTLPPYRILRAPLIISGLGPGGIPLGPQRITPSDLPPGVDWISEEVPFVHGIAGLEDMARERNGGEDFLRLAPPGEPQIATALSLMTGNTITSLHWYVERSAVRGLLGLIRAELARLVSELRAVTPPGQEPDPAQVREAANHITVTGDHNTLNVPTNTTHNTANAGGTVNTNTADHGSTITNAPGPGQSWWTWGRIGAFIAGAAGLAGAIFAGIQLFK